MEIIEKPLSKKQREELEQFVSISTAILRASIFVIFIGLLGAILRGIQIKTFDAPPIWLIVTAAIGVALYMKSKRWTGGPELRRKIRQDLEAGVSRVTVIEPAFVTEIEELEDEGPSYVIVTRAGESVLLTGQWLVWIKKRKFPWSKFEITEAPVSGHFFGVQNLGNPIPVSQKRDPLAYEQAKALGCFHSNYILLDDGAKKLLQEG